MMKRFSQISFILGILVFVTGIQPIWADTTSISIKIGEGSGGGYSYSGIHAATGCSKYGMYMCGDKLYWPLTGTLNADLNTNGTTSLTNITGTLNAPQGTMIISYGELSNASGKAAGFLNYELTDKLTETGTFYFVGKQLCCNGAPYGGPNNLTASGFTLWGNNWDVRNSTWNGAVQPEYHFLNKSAVMAKGFTPLGIDLVGGQYTTTPEPSTMMLLGSGLLALPFLRKKKQ